MRILRRLVLTELIFALICGTIAFIIMPFLCQRLGFSLFFRPPSQTISLDAVLKANTARAQAARKFLIEHPLAAHLFDYSLLNHTQFCLVIVTTNRRSQPHYLTQTTARIIQQLSYLSNYTFAIYNAGGTAHTEAMELAKLVPVVNKITDFPHHHIANKFDKERDDYVSALKWCLHKRSQYNIVLQDDALADENFVSKLNFALRFCLRDRQGKTWGILKLFYPEKYQGWGNHPSYVAELLVMAVIFGAVFSILSCFVIPGPVDCCTLKVNWRVFHRRFLLSMSLGVFLLLSFGRAHWEELRKLSPLFQSVVSAHGCCTPAVLYPRPHFQSLVNYLESIHCNDSLPVDLAVDRWIDKEHLRKLLVVPNLFNHIGLISSLPKGMKNPREFDLLFPPT